MAEPSFCNERVNMTPLVLPFACDYLLECVLRGDDGHDCSSGGQRQVVDVAEVLVAIYVHLQRTTRGGTNSYLFVCRRQTVHVVAALTWQAHLGSLR